MKNKTLIIIISLVAILILIASYFYFKKPGNTAMSEAVAIETLKTKFPELKDYPSDGSFPVKSIKTEQTSDGWYIAFIQEGSGVPIVGAQCFLIKNNKDTEQITYTSDDVFSPGEFSAKECRVIRSIVGGEKVWPIEGEGAACKLENCHGLDIKCGSNPPDYCTTMYGIGDKCLQYAKCGIQNGTCQQIIDPQFTQCKSCVEDCIENNKDDPMKSLECESKCN